MKTILSLVIALLLLQGCAYKNEPVALSAYVGKYKGDVLTTGQKLYIQSVKDLRVEPKFLGHKIKNGNKADPFMSEIDFKNRYAKDLSLVLKAAGFKVVSENQEGSWIVDVMLKNLELEYNNKSMQTNLIGRMEIGVVLKRGDKVTNLTFKPEASKWKGSLSSSKEIEPFLYDLFEQSLHEIAHKLAQY